MSNNVNTASAVLASAADAEKARKAAEKLAEKQEARSQDVSSLVLADAVRAVKETDSANWAFSTSVTAMCLDSLSRKVKRGEEFKAGKDGKISPTITKSNGDVLYALQVRSTYLGLQVYLDTKDHVAEIRGMSHASKSLKDSKIKAARDFIDGTHVQNGRMVSPDVTAARLEAGEFPGAKRKAMVSSFATARRMSAFLVSWFWHNRSDVIRGFDGRTLNGDDVEMIRAIIRDTFGDTFAELESAYKLGRPAPQPRAGLVERIQKSAEKANLEDIQALATYFQAKFSQMTAAAADAASATGLDNMPDFVPGFEDDADIAAAA